MEYHTCWKRNKNGSQKVVKKENIGIFGATDNKWLNGKTKFGNLKSKD